MTLDTFPSISIAGTLHDVFVIQKKLLLIGEFKVLMKLTGVLEIITSRYCSEIEIYNLPDHFPS